MVGQAASLILVALTAASGLPLLGNSVGTTNPPSLTALSGHLVQIAGSGTAWPAGPWPTYLGNPERTAANLEESVLSPSNASHLRVVWNVTLPGPPEDTPIVDHGTVYVSSWDGNVSAYYLTNGTRKWNTSVGASTFSSCYFSSARGPTSTATVVNGTLFIMGGNPYFYALNASNGSILWKVSEQVNSPSSGDYNWGSPLIFGSNAYLGIASACGSPGAQGMVEEVNLNGSTHRVTHTFAVVPSGSVLGGVWSTPSVDPAANLVWVSTGDAAVGTTYGQSIVALNATTLSLVGYWQLPVNCCDYDFGAGPTLFHDAQNRTLVAALNKDGVVYALNRSNVTSTGWKPIWSTNISWYANTSQGQAAGDFDVAPAAFGGSSLYVGGGFARLANGTNVSGTVQALDPQDGSRRWTEAAPGIVRAGLAYANGLVVDAADYPNNYHSALEVRNATDGTRLFSLVINGTVNGGPSVADGLILFGSGNWSLKGPGILWALGLPLQAQGKVLAVTGGPPGTVYVSANATGGVPPYLATWNFGDGTPSESGFAPTHTYSAPGSYTVVVTVGDALGDMETIDLSAMVRDIPLVVTIFVANPNVLVLGSNLTLSVATQGGMGPLSYAYSGLPNGCPSVNASTERCAPSASGVFLVRASVSDGFGESANASTNLTVLNPPPPSILISAFWAEPQALLLGQATTFTVLAVGGGGALTYSYAGLPPGCASADVSALRCVPSSVGDFDVRTSVIGPTGSIATAFTILNVTSPPLAQPPQLQVLAFWATPSWATVGENATWTTVVTGGQPPYSYAYAGLPYGCSSTNASSVTCQLSSPEQATVQVLVTDSAARTVNASMRFQVRGPSAGPAPTGAFPAWELLAGVTVGSIGLGLGLGVLLTRRQTRGPPTSKPPTK